MEQKIVELLTALQASATNLAPEAWNALVIGVRVDSILSLATTGLCSVLLLIYALNAKKAFKVAREAKREDEGVPAVAFLLAGGIIALVSLICIFQVGLASRTWLGLLHPEAQVVRDLLATATQGN